jgi:hypothetical protein
MNEELEQIEKNNTWGSGRDTTKRAPIQHLLPSKWNSFFTSLQSIKHPMIPSQTNNNSLQ